MSERHSEYARMPGDTYVTPQWVFDALYAVEKFHNPFDCAPVDAPFDFLAGQFDEEQIVTNPPFKLAEKFVRKSLDDTKLKVGKVAMLLPHAWDCAKSRVDLFAKPPFKAKYVLTRRIRWENLEQKAAGPSSNHAWYVWDWCNLNPPTMGWLL